MGLAISLVATGGNSSNAQDSLRYRFEPESRSIYDVKITAIIGDIREVREGSLTLEAVESTDQQTTLKAEGSLNLRRQSRDGSPVTVMPDIRFGMPTSDNVNIRTSPFSIDRYGNVVDIEVQTSLPYMLGDFEQLVLDELPKPSGEQEWKREREVSVVRSTRTSPFPRMIRPRGFGGPGFGPPRGFGPPVGFGPGNGEEANEDGRSAKETVDWKIQSREDGGIQVAKIYQLKTDDKVNGRPRRQLTGEGEMTFDPQKGLWRSGLMKYEIDIQDEGASATIPVTVSFRLLNESESAKRAEEAKVAKARNEAAMKKAAEDAKPKPLTAADRKRLLIDLRSSDEHVVQKAGDKLANSIPPEKYDDEVAEGLASAIASTNGFPRFSLAKALVVWGSPKQEKVYVKMLSTGDHLVLGPAIQGLAKCQTQTAAKVMVGELKELSSRHEASKALKTMDPEYVEVELQALLEERDVFTRNEATKILQEIGTSKSIPALEKLRDSDRPFAEHHAKEAIRAIERRQSLE
jgi:hypothetical protein